MDFPIEWTKPKKVRSLAGEFIWRREWVIPADFLNPFFQYWKWNKFEMKKLGYGVYKKDSLWILTESKISCSQFIDLADKVKPEEEEEPAFILPHYVVQNESGLRPWQVNSVAKLVSAIEQWSAALDGSDLGVGKSFVAAVVARELKKPLFVVCPKQVVTPWKRVVIDHFGMEKDLVGVINYESLRTGKKTSPYASIVWDKKNRRNKFTWKIPKDSLIVWDEAQKLKNWKTKNSKTCLAAKDQGYKMLFCSATMAVNPMDLRTVGTCLKMFRKASEYYEWLYEHGVRKGRFGLEFNNNPEVLKRIHKELYSNRGVRLTRDEIPGFPESELIAESYDMDDESTLKINQIADEMYKELALIERKEKREQSRMGLETRARQKAEMIKVPLFIDMAEEGLEDGFSVVIFVNYTETLHALASRLNTTCIYNGEDESTKLVKVGGKEVRLAVRDINVDLFQLNKERIILVNLASGGAGLGLHDIHGGHPRLALISPSYDPRHLRQSTGRVWRDGAKTKSIQKIVFVAGTVEENICRNVQQKLKNMDLLNNGDLTYEPQYQIVKD